MMVSYILWGGLQLECYFYHKILFAFSFVVPILLTLQVEYLYTANNNHLNRKETT